MGRELVERAIEGDFDAFGQLVRASTRHLYAVGTLILRDSDRAEDAVQEALVAAWQGLRGLRDPDAWEGWLHRLMVRACYRLARSEQRREVVELRVTLEDPSRHGVDPALALAERDRVERWLGRLPIEQRSVVVLHFFVGLPLTDAAAALEVPVGTAKSRLHRGLAALRAAEHAEGGHGVQLEERPA